ncbi:MAG: serine/threonine-protein phosphatase [Acidobacteria bacterium]|nr:serine/threonine-protein phosphatase [Acidobacteriota bacterium]
MNNNNGKNSSFVEQYNLIKNTIRVHNQILPYKRGMEFGNYDIYSWVIFANSLGGDHRSFIEFDKRYDLNSIKRKSDSRKDVLDYKNRLGILIADVSGHEFEDVLMVHNLHSSLFTALPYELEKYGEVSKGIFDNLNTRLFNSTPKGKYATAIYAELYKEKRARFMVAGHPPPLIYDVANREYIDIDYRAGCPLGLFQSKRVVDQDPDLEVPDKKVFFRFIETDLPKECLVVMYTDGFLEVEDENGDAYGLTRLKNVIAEHSHLSAKEIFTAALRANNRFLHGRRSLDDRTMVVIKCNK